MGQEIVIENNAHDFSEKLNGMMKAGHRIVPGTTYVSFVEHLRVGSDIVVEQLPYFFVVLSSEANGQVAVSATTSDHFHATVNREMKRGYKVVPGTIYITTVKYCGVLKIIEPIFSATLERD